MCGHRPELCYFLPSKMFWVTTRWQPKVWEFLFIWRLARILWTSKWWWISVRKGCQNQWNVMCLFFASSPCWPTCFLISMVFPSAEIPLWNFGTTQLSSSNGVHHTPGNSPTYHSLSTEMEPGTQIQQGLWRRCCVCWWTCRYGLPAQQERVATCYSRSERVAWIVTVQRCGQCMRTWLTSWTSCLLMVLMFQGAHLQRPSNFVWQKSEVIGVGIVTRSSWNPDGTVWAAVTNALLLAGLTGTSSQIIRKLLLGLGKSLPMLTSYPIFSSLAEFALWTRSECLCFSVFTGIPQNNWGVTNLILFDVIWGPLFAVNGVHCTMVRSCWAHNVHLGLFQRSNAAALLLGQIQDTTVLMLWVWWPNNKYSTSFGNIGPSAATVLQTLLEKRFFIKCLCCDCALHTQPLE